MSKDLEKDNRNLQWEVKKLKQELEPFKSAQVVSKLQPIMQRDIKSWEGMQKAFLIKATGLLGSAEEAYEAFMMGCNAILKYPEIIVKTPTTKLMLDVIEYYKLGLPIDKYAYFVPYKGVYALHTKYTAIIEILYRLGYTLHVKEVLDGEVFKVNEADKPYYHEEDFKADRKDPTKIMLLFCEVRNEDGRLILKGYLNREGFARHIETYSPSKSGKELAKNIKTSTTITDKSNILSHSLFQMWRKTLIRQIAPMLPMAISKKSKEAEQFRNLMKRIDNEYEYKAPEIEKPSNPFSAMQSKATQEDNSDAIDAESGVVESTQEMPSKAEGEVLLEDVLSEEV